METYGEIGTMNEDLWELLRIEIKTHPMTLSRVFEIKGKEDFTQYGEVHNIVPNTPPYPGMIVKFHDPQYNREDGFGMYKDNKYSSEYGSIKLFFQYCKGYIELKKRMTRVDRMIEQAFR